jgi:hypothetical protein
LPTSIIGIDGNGQGYWRFNRQISQFTVINTSAQTINLKVADTGPNIPIPPNGQFVAEEDLARGINNLSIFNGPVNDKTSIIILWTESSAIQRYLPH